MASNPDEVRQAAIAELARRELARRQQSASQPEVGPMGMQAPPGAMADIGRQAGLLGRSGLNAIAGLPLMAGDFGVTLGNLANRAMGGSQMELPSEGWQRGLTQLGVPEPQNTPEKIGGFLNTAIMGAALPAPNVVQDLVPKNFVPTSQLKNAQAFTNAHEAGYTVPPATVEPTFKNRFLESIGGKTAMQQDARMANSPVTEALSNRAFGLPETMGPVSMEDLSNVRQGASPAYEALKGLGTIKTDQTYLDALAKIGAKQSSAAKAFGGPFKGSAVEPYLEALAKEEIPADAAVDTTKILRDLADTHYANGDKSTAKAFKQASDAIEALLERRGKEAGQTGLVDAFRGARKTIAQTYSAEKAVNDAAGTFSPRALAAQLKRKVPLEGDLRTIGEFGARFPKISEPLLESPTRYTDAAVPAGLALLSGSPAPLAIPLTREAVRAYLLSPQYQRMMLERMTAPTTVGMPGTANVLRGILGAGATQ